LSQEKRFRAVIEGIGKGRIEATISASPGFGLKNGGEKLLEVESRTSAMVATIRVFVARGGPG